MAGNKNKRLSTRERLCAALILLLVKIIAPWEYDHQFKEVLTVLDKMVQGEDEID